MLTAAIRATTSCALALAVTGCSLADFVGGRIGTKVGTEIGKALPTPPAAVKVQVKGGDVCDVLPALGWPRRLPETTVTTIDGQTLRVILDTNDTVKACP